MRKTLFISISFFAAQFNLFAQIVSNVEVVKPQNIYSIFNDTSNSSIHNFSGTDTIDCEYRGESILVLIQYINGKRAKVTGYYDNGEKYREICYKDQEKDGYSIIYYKSGTIEWLSYYKNGKKIAPTFEFYESGSLKSHLDYKSSFSRGWYENGKLEGESIPIDTIFEDAILTKYYYENGNLKRIVHHNVEKGLATDYYENGQKWREGHIFNLELYQVGKWQEWYKNGVKSREYFFEENQPNVKTDTWSWWDEDGNLIKQEIYKNNKLLKEKKFVPISKKTD